MSSNTPDDPQAASTKVWDAALYDEKHSFVWKYGASLIELLAPQPGERVLDVGCGTGHLTAQIAAAGAAVVGIDKSPDMLEQARNAYPDLRFELADAVDFRFVEPFDAVFSNAVLHWILEPERALACIAQALKPGGRFVAELGGKGNMQVLIDAMYAVIEALGYPTRREIPLWYYPSIGQYTTLLEQQGFFVASALAFDRPTSLDGGVEGLQFWFKMFGSSFLTGIPAERQHEIFQRAEARLRPMLYHDGTWIAPYRRLRIVARKERSV